jgi:hypothetical protein
MCLKKTHVIVSSHVETNILHNDIKNVTNYVMGSNAFIVVSTM